MHERPTPIYLFEIDSVIVLSANMTIIQWKNRNSILILIIRPAAWKTSNYIKSSRIWRWINATIQSICAGFISTKQQMVIFFSTNCYFSFCCVNFWAIFFFFFFIKCALWFCINRPLLVLVLLGLIRCYKWSCWSSLQDHRNVSGCLTQWSVGSRRQRRGRAEGRGRRRHSGGNGRHPRAGGGAGRGVYVHVAAGALEWAGWGDGSRRPGGVGGFGWRRTDKLKLLNGKSTWSETDQIRSPLVPFLL